MSTTLTKSSIIVMPGWAHRAMLRNKLNNIDILDYRKVRQVLSVDDMAEWIYLNDRFEIDKCRLSDSFVDSIWHSITPEEKQEFTNSVLPLSGSEEIASSAKQKLMDSSMGYPAYQFIRIDNILYVILNEGFMSSLQEPSAKAEFVKNYLKECYAMASVADVSRLGVFKLYMQTFAI